MREFFIRFSNIKAREIIDRGPFLYKYKPNFIRFLINYCGISELNCFGRTIIWRENVEEIILICEFFGGTFSTELIDSLLSTLCLLNDHDFEKFEQWIKKSNFIFTNATLFELAIRNKSKNLLKLCSRQNIIDWSFCRCEFSGKRLCANRIESIAPQKDPAIVLVENFPGDVCQMMFEKFPEVLQMSSNVLHKIFVSPNISADDYQWIKKCALKFMTFKRFMRIVGEHRPSPSN
jgi:hypothetical protein